MENGLNLKYIVEGILFASGEAISISKISGILSETKENIEQAITELKQTYQDENRCLDIIKKGEEGDMLYQIVTNKNISQIIQKLHNTVLDGDLTKSGLEVLSIIMYRAPLNRSEIDEIRGVNSSYILRALSLRGLINRYQNPKRKSEYLYEPSFDIMKHLGLTSTEELPEFEDLNSFSLKEILSKEQNNREDECFENNGSNEVEEIEDSIENHQDDQTLANFDKIE